MWACDPGNGSSRVLMTATLLLSLSPSSDLSPHPPPTFHPPATCPQVPEAAPPCQPEEEEETKEEEDLGAPLRGHPHHPGGG